MWVVALLECDDIDDNGWKYYWLYMFQFSYLFSSPWWIQTIYISKCFVSFGLLSWCLLLFVVTTSANIKFHVFFCCYCFSLLYYDIRELIYLNELMLNGLTYDSSHTYRYLYKMFENNLTKKKKKKTFNLAFTIIFAIDILKAHLSF